jgi:hypothetical protein
VQVGAAALASVVATAQATSVQAAVAAFPALSDWREKFWARRYRSIVISGEEAVGAQLPPRSRLGYDILYDNQAPSVTSREADTTSPALQVVQLGCGAGRYRFSASQRRSDST